MRLLLLLLLLYQRYPRPLNGVSPGLQPDITRAKKFLGWEPKTQLREGLAETIAFCRALDLKKFKQPTNHTAHKNSEEAAAGGGGGAPAAKKARRL